MTNENGLREKLKAIRDSDHPARYWARNIIQTMDESGDEPDVDQMRALALGVARLERTMTDDFRTVDRRWWLTPDEIAAIFGLGDPQ